MKRATDRGLVRTLTIVALVALGYAIGSQLSFMWFEANGINASFFPAAGVTIAALIALPPRDWPAVLVAAGITEIGLDLLHGIDLAPSVGFAVANLAQPLAAVAVIGSARVGLDLARLRDLGAFLLGAVLVGPAVGGVIGATNQAIFSDADVDWLRFAAEWWVGDGLGALVIGATLVGLPSMRITGAGPARQSEALGLVFAAAAGSFVAFRFDVFVAFYIPLVLLFVIAVRVGTRAVAFSGALVALIAAEGMARGHQFWANLSVDSATGLLYLQLALLVFISSALGMSAALSERETSALQSAVAGAAAAEAELAQQRAELLGDLAERLGRATTAVGVRRGLIELDLGEAWPADWPNSLATTVLDAGRAERLSANEQQHRILLQSASGMARDALQRVRLIAHERMARERAELLEAHAARLAAAASTSDVAGATVEELAALMPEVVQVWVLRHGTLELLAVVGGSGEMVGDTLSVSAAHPVSTCAREGRAVVIDGRNDEGASLGLLADESASRAESVVVYPLSAQHGGVIGALLVSAADGEWLSDQRRQVLAGVADQCGLALERAELQRLANRATADAELLARLSERLDRSTTAYERATQVVDQLVESGAVAATIRIVDSDNVDNVDDVVLATAGAVDVLAQPASIVLQLQARGRVLGRIEVVYLDHIEPQNRKLVHDIASRAAVAIDNALLYERERDISHRLQLGLLNVQVPELESANIEASYRPGTATLDIGGDWHDAFMLPSGELALVVGDVVGHGLDAAIAMAQLRGAVRALAAVSTPAELLDRLDVFVDSLPAAQMTTLVYVAMEPDSGRMRYACAGHPPPLVVSATGVTRYLWEGRSAPLGLHFGANRVEGAGTLENTERLLLYTDGLIERRGEDLDVGLARLHAMTRHDVASDDFVDRVHRVMVDDTIQRDDVCVLSVVRCEPGTFSQTILPTAANAAALRADLRRWLAEGHVPAEYRHDTLLAASEAVANAVEHAADGHLDRPVVLVATAEDDEVCVVVRDHGTWRRPTPSADRGRGLQIMRTLMSEVDVERLADGTLVRLRRSYV